MDSNYNILTTQINNNAAIRGFSTSSYSTTHTKTNQHSPSSKISTTSSPFINDDMNLFNVNFLPLFNTIKVFLTNFIKSKYSAACDNQFNNKTPIDYNNTTTLFITNIMPHHKTINSANIVLQQHPNNSKFHSMDECSYIQFNCMSMNTFSCINLPPAPPSTSLSSGLGTPSKSTITIDKMVFLDKSTISMKMEPHHCFNNTTKDIDNLIKDLKTSPKAAPKQEQQPSKLKVNSKLSAPKMPTPKNTIAAVAMSNSVNGSCASGSSTSSGTKSQHHRRKNRGKNRKSTTANNNNNVSDNTNTHSQQSPINVETKKSNKKNKNRKRSTCSKSKIAETPTTSSTIKSSSDKTKTKNNKCLQSVPTKIMCITSETIVNHNNNERVTNKSTSSSSTFTNNSKILHQTTNDGNDDNYFFTIPMFINPFECVNRPLARTEQLDNCKRNSRQRHISDSSDDFICFELSDNEIEPQMIYTTFTGSCIDDDDDEDDDDNDDFSTDRWWTNNCDSDDNVKRWNKPSADDHDYHDKHESLDGKKKVRFNLKPTIHVMHVWEYAYRQARKGTWEYIAVDRVRFRERTLRTEEILSPILTNEHRLKIFNERFSST